MLQSKFRLWVLLPLLLSIILLLSITSFVKIFSAKINLHQSVSALLSLIFFIFLFLWLVWGELRTKVIKVSIQDNNINARNFLGLGFSKSYLFSEIDGFQISFLHSDSGYYEYLYIIKGKKKVIKLSEFYHQNYKELKGLLSSKLNDMGVEKFNYWRELKEIFS
ncbi:MAG: hypothetical protein JST86_13135 [Bacteroidetes bacterium]|nr:hypothetical protein [Bacteroidota bacterium]